MRGGDNELMNFLMNLCSVYKGVFSMKMYVTNVRCTPHGGKWCMCERP